jgi:hypothetical protein
MRAMHAGAAGPYLFTLTAGRSGADFSGIFKRVRHVADTMLAADELPGGRFTPGDLRRTVETTLSGAHVSKETRARLQSHGLNGVQERHYDKHECMAEKRAALEVLYNLLTDTSADVVPTKRPA